MSSRNDVNTKKLLTFLQDETRLAIYTHLLIYKKLTLKQLSNYLGKGKTTIHHHIKKFENRGFLEWEEQEEDRKKLKTRHYSIPELVFKTLSEKASIIERLKIDILITKNLSDQMIKYIETQIKDNDSFFDNFDGSFIQRIPLTDEILPIYKDLLTKATEIKENSQSNNTELPITHIGTHIFIPIRELFEWNLRNNIDED